MTDPLTMIRQAALELPETEERLSHGQPTFFVAGKQFAQFRANHHGDGKTVVCVRTSGLDEQAMLLEADPATYSKPAYLPTWVSINLARESVDWTMSPTGSPRVGSLPRPGACSKLAADERDRIGAAAPALDHLWRADRACRAHRVGGRRVDQLEDQRHRQAD